MEDATNMDCATPGLQKSPIIFGNQSAKEIGKLENLDRTLLQCVDDILPATKTERKHLDASVSLLNFLG